MLLDDIDDYLTTQGMLTSTSTSPWGIYKGFRPPNPDIVIALYETGGQAPVRAMGAATGNAVEVRPGLQVVVRAGEYDYDIARKKASDIYGVLDNFAGTINGIGYRWIAAMQEPFQMGRDEQERPLLACNYSVAKVRSTS